MTDREAFEAWWTDNYAAGTHEEKEWAREGWQAALASERAKQAEPGWTTKARSEVNDATRASAIPAVQAEPVAPKFWKAKGLDPCENCGQLWRTHTGGMWKCPDAAPPAVQGEPEPTNVTGYAAPPADDEAVRLLMDACELLRKGGKSQSLVEAIDAYLARVEK